MNIIQEKIRSVHVFTPPATLGKQRNNFVSRDNFGPYCTVYIAWFSAMAGHVYCHSVGWFYAMAGHGCCHNVSWFHVMAGLVVATMFHGLRYGRPCMLP